MNIVQALKAFFNALNGQSPTGDNISDVIRNGTANVSRNNESVLATRVDALESVKTEIIIKSSTAGSVKRFSITVVDDGTISATEIVEA